MFSPTNYPTSVLPALHDRRLGFVLTRLLVLRMTHVGTGEVCLVFLMSRILREDGLRAGILVLLFVEVEKFVFRRVLRLDASAPASAAA
jgi:hypothetical protein